MARKNGATKAVCVADKVVAQLTAPELGDIGITDKGVNSTTLVPLSLSLEPATVTFWDIVFECGPPDSTELYSGSDPAVMNCITSSIVNDKYLRLVLVVGTKKGSTPSPLYDDLGAKLNAALSACGATTS